MKHVPSLRSRLGAGLAIASLAASPLSLHATDLYWGGWDGVATTGLWSTAENWFTDIGETSASGAAPTIDDALFFNTTPDNALGGTINLSGNVFAQSITYNTSANTTISQNGTTRSLTLGSGGITVNSGAGALTFGVSTAALTVEITANQTWTNNSTSTLTVRSPSVSNTAAGNTQLTVNAASSGGIALLLGVKDSADTTKALTLVIDSAGTGEVSTINANTHSGGTVIKRGTLKTRTDMGTGTITMGDTSGSANSTLRLDTANAVTNTLVVQAGNTGINTLEFLSTTAGNYSGDITLDNDLVIGARGSTGGTTLSGVISGSGNLHKGRYQGSATTGALTFTGVNTYSGDTFIEFGAFTLADDAALTFYIGADGVTNQVHGGGANIATFDGDFIINLDGASLVDGNSWQLVDVDTLNESFSASFTVQGFSETDNIWSNGTGLLFDESSGVLSYVSTIPEPSSWALIAGGAALLLCAQRRRRSA